MRKHINLQSIKVKMLIALLLPVCLMIVIGVEAYDKAYDGIVQTFTESVEQSVSMTSDYINFGLEKVKQAGADYLVDGNINDYFENKMEASAATTYQTSMQESFVSKVDTDSFINGIYIFGDKAYSISTSQDSFTDLYSQFVTSPQGQEAAAGEYSWYGNSPELDSLLSIDSDSYILRLTKKYYKDDIMLAIDIKPESITDIMQSLDFGEGSIVSFITKDAREINKEGVMEQVLAGTEFYQLAQQSGMQSGYIENVTYENGQYMFLFSKVNEADGMVCVLVPNQIIVARVAPIKSVIAVLVAIAAALSALIGVVIVHGITRSISKLIDTMEKLSTGNFAIELPKIPKDEMGTLSKHVGSMIAGVRNLIDNVSELEGNVSVSMDQIEDATDNMADTSKQIRDAVNQVGDGFDKQVTETDNCSNVMNNLSTEIQNVKEYTDSVSQVASLTSQSIEESQEQMVDLQQRSAESIQMNKEIVDIINNLSNNITNIEDIIDTVNKIAGKTKLLALNASIEAARAGELGKGFSVVALEVGALANQSSESTANINEIVSQVKNDILQAVDKSAQSKEVIDLQEQALSNTSQGFENMQDNIRELMDKFQMISEKINNMEEEKNASMESIESIAITVNENVNAMKEVIESINNQADMAINMSQLSKEVKERMVTMEQSINQFKV